MPWEDLPPGNWTSGAPKDRLDPYLAWAEATGFVDFGLMSDRGASPQMPETIPVLMELDEKERDRLAGPMALDQSALPGEPDQPLLPGEPDQPPRPGDCDQPPLPGEPDQPPRPPPDDGDLSGDLPRWARVLLGLLEGNASGLALAPPSRFVTLSIKPGFYRQLAESPVLKRLLKRIEMSRPVSRKRWGSAPILWFGNVDWATSPVAGVIDNGCAFAHVKFRSNSGTRVWAVWDQDLKMTGAASPPSVGEPQGVIHRAALESFMNDSTPAGKPIDEDLCYSLAAYEPLRRRATHGTHILDVLAGGVRPRDRVVVSGQAPPTFQADPVSQAGKSDIVFVQLQQAEIEDDSGKWLGVQVLEAILFICSHAPPGGLAVVNLSYGPHTGPHDGSSMLEQAIDEAHAVALLNGGRELSVTLPAGNSFANRSHANIDLPVGGSEELIWQIPPASETSAFLEIWLPEGAPLDKLTVELFPPEGAGPPSGPVEVGQMKGWFNPNLLAAVIFLENVPQSDVRTMILVAIAPTFSYSGTRAFAPCGDWRVHVANSSSAVVSPVHAYVARNGTTLGAKVRGRQSHLYDAQFDPTAYLRRAPDDPPLRVSALQRRESLNGIATGQRSRVGAGYVLAAREPSSYSSAGPSAGDSPRNPDIAAVSDESTALAGLRGAGTRSASHVRISGTSIAAPQLARWRIDPPPQIIVASVDQARTGAGLGSLP